MKYIFVLIFLLSCSSTYTVEDRLQRVRIIRVVDGDTFWAKMENGELGKIRLAYIDAPELSQSYGIYAQYVLDSLIRNKTLLYYHITIDTFHRRVGVCYLPSLDITVNEFMVNRGMAWAYKYYSPIELQKKMNIAKSKRIGLWRDFMPVSPYVFRHKLY